MSPTGKDAIVTPEAVALTIDVAGLGSRMIALLIDTLIQAALMLLALLVFAAGASGTASVVGVAVSAFLIFWGYFPIVEAVWNGRTPGKRAQRLRVVKVDGQPVDTGAAVVRNLLRIVDFLPLYYVTGAIAIVLSHRSQRVGDRVAGTMVVRERRAPLPAPPPATSAEATAIAGRLDTRSLGEREYDLVRQFLQRRETLDQTARAGLAHQIATTIRARVPAGDTAVPGDETFLEAVARAYRTRFSAPLEDPPPDSPDASV